MTQEQSLPNVIVLSKGRFRPWGVHNECGDGESCLLTAGQLVTLCIRQPQSEPNSEYERLREDGWRTWAQPGHGPGGVSA